MTSQPSSPALIRTEIKATAALASIFALRMFGLFMLLPVFSLLGAQVPESTPLLIGTAIGIYGLMQALLQIPFGMLSDRLGRRPMLLLGLVLFVCGGVVAATADSIYGIIAGRALQGAGAIASVIMALVSDVVSEAHRVRAMAAIGMSVGGSFVLALILGPVLVSWLGLPGLFWLISGLGVLAILVLMVVPSPQVQIAQDALSRREGFRRVFANGSLMRLNMGILVLHLVMTTTFVVLPLLLSTRLGMPLAQHSVLYLVVLLVGTCAMVPLIILSERRGFRSVKLAAVLLLVAAEVALALAGAALWHFVLALVLFFTAFNLLEALLPSLVGRAAPPGAKGVSMGVYSTSQFIGVFIGGELGGLLLHYGDGSQVFWLCALLLLVWAYLVKSMADLPKLDNRVLPLTGHEDDQAIWVSRLLAVDGVLEAVVVAEENMALLKVDPVTLDEAALAKWSQCDA